jgi:hypothetical protein
MALQHFVGQSQELALAAATAITPEEREERQKQVITALPLPRQRAPHDGEHAKAHAISCCCRA